MSDPTEVTPTHASAPPTRGRVRSVNVGAVQSSNPAKPHTSGTGINKLPVDEPVRVRTPRPKNSGPGQSGLVGDVICDIKHHGGPDQAVYAYAREDLDWWGQLLGRDLPDGMFGENLTTEGLNLTDAVLGERWRIGEELVLEARLPRVPCVTFAARMAEPRWIKRFTEVGVTGAYLRVVTPGDVRAGDPIEVLTRPAHGVTIATYFRAITTQRDRLAELLPAREFLADETLDDLARNGH
jgi:MOSC domain-containing protein YiiM